MKLAFFIALGIILWLGGYAIKGVYVSEEVGKGLGAMGWLILAFVCFFSVKNSGLFDSRDQRDERDKRNKDDIHKNGNDIK